MLVHRATHSVQIYRRLGLVNYNETDANESSYGKMYICTSAVTFFDIYSARGIAMGASPTIIELATYMSVISQNKRIQKVIYYS